VIGASVKRASYVLITPIRNEAESIRNLVDTVAAQKTRPVLWVIIDGRSTDGSYDLASHLADKYNWISVIRQEKFPGRDYCENFSQSINEALDYAVAKYIDEAIDFDFVGKIDATIILSEDYFDVLLTEMISDEGLAITCGISHFMVKGKEIILKPSKDKFIGFSDTRLYRRDFLQTMGGYPLAYATDTILLIKAWNRNWRTKVVESTYFTDSRVGGGKIGVWIGFRRRGHIMHTLNCHPIVVLLNALHSVIRVPPRYAGLAILEGYFESVVNKTEKLKDSEITDYMWKRRVWDLLFSLVRKNQ